MRTKNYGRDKLVIAALAAGHKREVAAEMAKVSVSTVYRRLRDAEFVRKVDECRAAMVSDTTGRLAANGTAAVDGLVSLFNSENEHIRLRAYLGVLDNLPKFREHAELNERLEKLESQHASNEKPIGERFEAFAPSRNGFH